MDLFLKYASHNRTNKRIEVINQQMKRVKVLFKLRHESNAGGRHRTSGRRNAAAAATYMLCACSEKARETLLAGMTIGYY